jgi:6-phosphogluconolactonase
MLVFIGTYTEPILFGTGKVLQGKGEGIYACRLDERSGALERIAVTTGVVNPSYLAFDRSRRFLYAVNELKTFEGRASGTVSAFSVDRDSGELEFMNRQLTRGTDPCHVSLDAACRHVFVANFASGSVCVLPVRDDGSLADACDFVQHRGSGTDPRRQAGPHAHSVTLDAANRFAFVPDLGLDKLMIYRYDSERGTLAPNAKPSLDATPGAGPRHLAFHPQGRFAYLVNELDSTVVALAYDASDGTFERLQTVSTLPGSFVGESTCADIDVGPSGRFVYASNRGHDSIAVYRIARNDGTLSLVEHASTQGRTPRSFGIDPSGRFLLAANQDTDAIATFRIDADTGALRFTGEIASIPTPVCVKFAPDGGATAVAAAVNLHASR